jgi:cation transport ATPase
MWTDDCESLIVTAGNNGRTGLALAIDGKVVAILALADVPRPDASKVDNFLLLCCSLSIVHAC